MTSSHRCDKHNNSPGSLPPLGLVPVLEQLAHLREEWVHLVRAIVRVLPEDELDPLRRRRDWSTECKSSVNCLAGSAVGRVGWGGSGVEWSGRGGGATETQRLVVTGTPLFENLHALK